MKQMRRPVLKILAVVVLTGAILGGIALGAALWLIHRSVQETCEMAQQAHPHPGDNVAALIDYMNSEEHSLKDRNRAIWTLQRLADPAALPALQAVYTGEPCDHEHRLCQYELEKAIKRCGGTPLPPRSGGD